ncbi:MAG TPA: DUF929 family protein [Streptosporangiaceae bacterium]|jgi:hypothetical protein
MGKADRLRQQSAREKIAAQQATARREARRRQWLMTGGAVGAVLVIVIALVAFNVLHQQKAAAAKSNTAVASQLTSVPASTLDSVGKGTAGSLIPISNAPALTSNGKPEMLYVGGEYCPFCAAERWAMAIALSRFGTLSNLNFIHSSPTDGNVATLTFYKSSYTSKYLSFVPVEWYGESPDSSSPTGYHTLQVPDSTEQGIFNKYNAPPYVVLKNKGAFPFVDFGNKFLISGSQYGPTDLGTMTWSQIAKAVQDPSSKVAKDIDGSANTITAAICQMTGNQPASVCSSAAAKAGAGAL